jgi:hypothetical protein
VDRADLAAGHGVIGQASRSCWRAAGSRRAGAYSTIVLVVAALLLGLVGAPADAGHELPFYPSFYPHEITIERIDRLTVAALLANGRLHAYVGADPFAGGAVPEHVTPFESLGSYLVLTFNPASAAFSDRRTRCAAAMRVARDVARAKAGYVFHPYPITPYHADYLHYFDLAQAAKAQRDQPASARAIVPKLRARGHLAEALINSGVMSGGSAWDATVEELELDRLIEVHRVRLDGSGAPPWLTRGWYHTYLLERSVLCDRARQQVADADYARLTRGETRGAKRVELERRLVSTLTGGCERFVLGYRVRREYVNSEYSQGVENVAHDAHAGLNAPIFIRSVKLKDFPWNGWLRLGVETPPAAPWNPITGFGDAFGRLLWSAVGDPALISRPGGPGWLGGRVTARVPHVEGAPARVDVPTNALAPEPGTGRLLRVGAGKRAAVKVEYHVRASAFHDGTRMSVADALYPFAFAFRWGAPVSSTATRDPAIAAATALLRERLVAIRPVKIETVVRNYGDVKFVYDVPIVDVYLSNAAGDADDTAALAPPWSAVPWHVIALAEEAVKRGLATFAPNDAARPNVPPLDIVRNTKLTRALEVLVDEFSARAFVPPALATMVKPDDARQRWNALRRFYRQRGHFLVTNGPYRLKQWSKESVVLDVFRDMAYPLGVGTFDEYAIPVKAYVAKVEERGDHLEVRADVERASRFARSYEIVREPLGASASPDVQAVPTCRYVVVGADGHVVLAGVTAAPKAGMFRIDLSRIPAPGHYVVLIGLILRGTVNPEVTMIKYVAS